MKNILINDKSTNKDEIILIILTAILAIISAVAIVIGLKLNITVVATFGIILAMEVVIINIPIIVYRLKENDKNDASTN